MGGNSWFVSDMKKIPVGWLMARKPSWLVDDVKLSWLVDGKKTQLIGRNQLFAVITRVSMEVSIYS